VGLINLNTSTMTNPFSKDYKPLLDLTDQRKSARSSRQASKSRDERLSDPSPHVRAAARGTIPGVSVKDPVSDWERVKVIKKPSNL
jgi:hypothetical protein